MRFFKKIAAFFQDVFESISDYFSQKHKTKNENQDHSKVSYATTVKQLPHPASHNQFARFDAMLKKLDDQIAAQEKQSRPLREKHEEVKRDRAASEESLKQTQEKSAELSAKLSKQSEEIMSMGFGRNRTGQE